MRTTCKRGAQPDLIAQAHRQHKEQAIFHSLKEPRMKPIICPCGTEKDVIHGVSACCHCDQLCPDRAGCYLCGQYSLNTNQRVTAEHAREKANG